MPTNSSGAAGQLYYGVETTAGTAATSRAKLRQTGFNMKAGISTTTSKEIRQDRLTSGLIRTDLNIDGGFNFEFSAKEYDTFIEGLMNRAYTHYGTNGISAALGTVTVASGTFTNSVATTGNDKLSTLMPQGGWFKFIPPSGATATQKAYFADAWFKVSTSTAPTDTVITLDASTPVAAAGLGSYVGPKISHSRTYNIYNGQEISTGVPETFLNRTFSLEYAMTDITQYLAFLGCRVNSFSLDLQVGSLVTGAFNFIGMSHPGMSATNTVTGTPAEAQTFDAMNAVTDVGTLMVDTTNLVSGNSFIKSVKLDVNNNLRGQKALGVFGNTGTAFGELAITGNIEMYVQDATYYNKWLNGTSVALSVGMADSAGNGYLFAMPKVIFGDGSINPGDQSNDAMLSLPFTAIYDPTSTRGLQIYRAIAA